ncbi:MAG: hypothetical protein VXY93_12555, partial [Pseudomonadota bacterium]|nr:hypothetical protein [Pseudomonadota bacterium]
MSQDNGEKSIITQDPADVGTGSVEDFSQKRQNASSFHSGLAVMTDRSTLTSNEEILRQLDRIVDI